MEDVLVQQGLAFLVCRLTIGEFAPTLADVVSKARTRTEREEIAAALHKG